MMSVDRDYFERWMERITVQLDEIEDKIHKLSLRYDFMQGIEFIELHDLMHLLKSSRTNIYRLIDSGKLKGFNMNGKRFFWTEEVVEYIKSHKTEK